MCSAKTMLTRALLLLLAMMTGLSAAQAAERVRPAHGLTGVSAAVAQTLGVASEIQAKRQASSYVVTAERDWPVAALAKCAVLTANAPPAIHCTHRADRARE